MNLMDSWAHYLSQMAIFEKYNIGDSAILWRFVKEDVLPKDFYFKTLLPQNVLLFTQID